MSFTTTTLRDTVVNASGAGGTVTILVNIDNDTTATNAILDASELDGHANGAKLHISRIWWGLVQGTADDNTGHVQIQFKGASSDTIAIQLAGTGHYDGTAGAITNNATNTTLTSDGLVTNKLISQDNITIDNANITSASTNANINLTANGTGTVNIGDLKINGSTITNTGSGDMTMTTLGLGNGGVVQFGGTGGFVIPAGSVADRPIGQLGATRYNTVLKYHTVL